MDLSLIIWQWNARGLPSNGAELTQHIYSSPSPPHVILVQETWCHDDTNFSIPKYTALWRNRVSSRGGGCAIFIHQDVNFSNIHYFFAE